MLFMMNKTLTFFILSVITPTILVQPNMMNYFVSLNLINMYMLFLSYTFMWLMMKTTKMLMKWEMLNMKLLFSLLLMVFISKNIILFYILFELSTIPLFFLIINKGLQKERMTAGLLMIFYTLMSSLPFLLMIIWMNSNQMNNWINMMKINNLNLSIMLVFVFFCKMPIYLFHSWLPKAHVESPVEGSMILAGIMLKIGGFGLFQMSLNNWFLETNSFKFSWLIIYGGVMSSLICILLMDSKTLIAYSSISHMSLIILCFMMGNNMMIKSIIVLMISHGFCSSGLFYLLTEFYSKINTRVLILNRFNFKIFMMVLMIILILMNMSIPPTLNFWGELMILMVLFNSQYLLNMLLMVLILLVSFYNLIFFIFMSHGKSNYNLSMDQMINSLNVLIFCITPNTLLILLIY